MSGLIAGATYPSTASSPLSSTTSIAEKTLAAATTRSTSSTGYTTVGTVPTELPPKSGLIELVHGCETQIAESSSKIMTSPMGGSTTTRTTISDSSSASSTTTHRPHTSSSGLRSTGAGVRNANCRLFIGWPSFHCYSIKCQDEQLSCSWYWFVRLVQRCKIAIAGSTSTTLPASSSAATTTEFTLASTEGKRE